MESRLEPSRASKLWVIESLVKIMDQIESIQEIRIFPCFLSPLQGFSDTLALTGTGKDHGHRQKIRASRQCRAINPLVLDAAFLNATPSAMAPCATKSSAFSMPAGWCEQEPDVADGPEGWHFLTTPSRGPPQPWAPVKSWPCRNTGAGCAAGDTGRPAGLCL